MIRIGSTTFGDISWKRDNDFSGRFQELVKMLLAEPVEHYDFAEFVFVGDAVPDSTGHHAFHITDTVFPKQAYFTAACFLDSLEIERTEFRDGADFNQATFVGDLRTTNARINGFDATRAEFRRFVSFTKVKQASYALFGNARFIGTEYGRVVKFEDSRFEGLADFSDVEFVLGDQSSVEFVRTRFDDSTDFSRARFRCQLVFGDVSFAGSVDFVDTSFEIIKSSAQYRGSAVEFNRIEVTANAVLRFENSGPTKKMFGSTVQMSFKEPPAGLISFENVNFNNIDPVSRERLIEFARSGKVVIGSGCIKYRFQSPITEIKMNEGNTPLVVNLCQTFTHYFTVCNGFNLGFEVVQRTSTLIRFYYFTDEDISEELFRERLEVTSRHMWSLLSVRSTDQLRALESPTKQVRPVDKENAELTALDCIVAMIAILFSAGTRTKLGRWKEADTRALWRATRLEDDGAEVAHALHVVLVDRYTGTTLFDINKQQHAGLILAYRDEPIMDTVDFAILTAIEVERKAVCDAFGLTDEHRVRKDSRVYWRGTLPLQNGEVYELVVAQAPDAANVDSALLTNDLLHHWKPGAALLVGIAASTNPDKVKLGDVVLGSEVYYYERGKVTPEGTRPEPKIISADATLWSRVTTIPDWDGRLRVARPDKSNARPTVHAGVIASGEKVIADAPTRDEIAAVHRKIVAIEMEGYGFSRAVWQSFEHVRHLDIRAICDDGSESKNDDWHLYAAAAAAGLTKHFLLDRPLAPRHGGASRRS